ncbi:hypothetical protein [Gottfriedia solisilvae]|uniref:Uncharacterized protein n=1 Tax=Gottfriedia solisilvae TaxID=1516104 RepID=A0A8J3EWF1_9BACI|nr:hypothetical protein [Gottfriedia solisilvae]GGI11631.1 hypothetical protein GCM10007380_08810 [Gottfriedia solisilvae]
MGIFICIYSNKHIGAEKYAKRFFDLMNERGFEIEKIGLFEPVKKPFTINDAISMWTKEEPGIYDVETDKMIGKAGGVLGKSKGFWFDTHWWLHPTELRLNHITIYLNKKIFSQRKNDILPLFEELVNCFEATYGYVTEQEAEDRQHITGTLKERIPGIFWVNYFSTVFVDYLNSGNSFYDFPWKKIKECSNMGILTQLTENPFDPTIADLEKKAHELFGVSKFNGTARDYPKILMP